MEDDTPTSEWLAIYAAKHAEVKALKVRLAKLEDIMTGIEDEVLSRMPAEADSMVHALPDGTKMKMTRKVSERYIPSPGKADDFWAWAKANSQWSLASRTVLQSGVTEYLKETGSLPEHIEVMSTTKLSIVVTASTPK